MAKFTEILETIIRIKGIFLPLASFLLFFLYLWFLRELAPIVAGLESVVRRVGAIETSYTKLDEKVDIANKSLYKICGSLDIDCE